MPKISGGGHFHNATKCIRVLFDHALSTAPLIEAWDNSQVYPQRDLAGSSVVKEIFVGTTENGMKPMMAGFCGGVLEGALSTPGLNWHPDNPVAGAGNPNLLKGTVNYIECPGIPLAGQSIVFNLSLRAPFDASVPSTVSMNALIQIRYTYTGDAPSPAFYLNTGTEAVPNWQIFVPGAAGIRFCNANTEPPIFKFTLPESGQAYAPEVWVTDS